MTTKEPFREPFMCSLLSNSVTISGVKVYLTGPSGPVASERARVSCSGMAHCGQRFGSPPCPYNGSGT